MKKLKFKTQKPEENAIRLDLGTGKGAHKPEGYIGVDKVKHAGVDMVLDLCARTPQFKNSADPFSPHGGQFKSWPWKSNSVDEVNCAMMLHYLSAKERVHFFNELWRVLKPDSKAQIVTPMWSSHRSYIDLQGQWPPVSEGFYHTLSRDWREAQNAVDTSGLKCNFDAGAGYSIHPSIVPRAQAYQQEAVAWNKEAAQDLIATLAKRE